LGDGRRLLRFSERPSGAARGREYQLLTPLCKPPPQGGGDNMFEALTPDYQKKRRRDERRAACAVFLEGKGRSPTPRGR
jgi:hypothetical protein